MIRPEWLQPVAAEAPCGPSLEYDGDFLALEQATRGKAEQQYGKTVIPAEAPDWTDVVNRATALLDRTRDVRIAVHYTRGLARTQGLAGLRDGLALLRDLLEKFWDPLHPQLANDGEVDPLIRINALGALADGDGLVRDARAAIFIKCSLGTFTVRDLEKIIEVKEPTPDQPVTAEQIRAVVRDAIKADPAALSEATQAMESLDRIRAIVVSRFEPSQAPDFTPLRNVLKGPDSVTRPIREELQKLAAGAAGAAVRAAPEAAGAPPATLANGEIHSRDDAVRALEKVCDYLARTEPTSPAPLLIRRAQRLMTMPFLDIIKDLAPDAMGAVEKITGAKKA